MMIVDNPDTMRYDPELYDVAGMLTVGGVALGPGVSIGWYSPTIPIPAWVFRRTKRKHRQRRRRMKGLL